VVLSSAQEREILGPFHIQFRDNVRFAQSTY